jgi:hypothetical protein
LTGSERDINVVVSARKQDVTMTHEEMLKLEKGALVVVEKTGKVYRCDYVSPPKGDWKGNTHFIQQRDGKDYGPVRFLKAENIRRDSQEDDGSSPADLSAWQRPVQG